LPREHEVGSFDRPGEPDDPSPSDRRGKSANDGASDRPEGSGSADRPRNSRETEADAAERLGLSTLTRGDYYDSQRAAADAQEAAIRRRDAESRDKDPDASNEGESTKSPPDRPPVPIDQPERRLEEPKNYWTEVPRFFAMWQRIAESWPWKPRSETADAASKLSPEQQSATLEEVDKVPAREPPISENIKRIEADNNSGGWLEGYEFRMKGQDRLTEKVAERLKREPERTPEELVTRIPDAVRYTFCLEQKNYTAGYQEIAEKLEGCGYEMYHRNNFWTNSQYKGVNTRWVTSDGQRFEVQFHTPESFHAKHEVTHVAYERLRHPATSVAERRDLMDFQREVSSWVPVPNKASDISDYEKKGF
jgi:hypothetical protein